MIEVHPLAALFPMMTDDELQDLADDIKENGLLHPIVLDADGVLIDGRNRLRACEIAGIEPQFEALNGHDAAAFIVTANIARRNLTKSQQAMALAMIYPEPGKRGVKTLDISRSEQTMVGQARAILRHSTELAHDVLHRGTHFDTALKLVQGDTQRRKAHDAQMSELRAKAPDVAAMVDDGRLTVEAGLQELGNRQREIRQVIADAEDSLRRFTGLGAHLAIVGTALSLTDADLKMVGHDPREFDPLRGLADRDIEQLGAAAAWFTKHRNGEE